MTRATRTHFGSRREPLGICGEVTGRITEDAAKVDCLRCISKLAGWTEAHLHSSRSKLGEIHYPDAALDGAVCGVKWVAVHGEMQSPILSRTMGQVTCVSCLRALGQL